MASGWYNKGRTKVADSTINLASDVVRAMLVKSSYSFNPDHNFVSDVSASEISGVAGYARQTVANIAVTQDDANNRAKIDGDDAAYGVLGAGDTIGGAILYRQTGGSDVSPTDDELLFFIDTADVSTNGSSVTLVMDSAGIAYIG